MTAKKIGLAAAAALALAAAGGLGAWAHDGGSRGHGDGHGYRSHGDGHGGHGYRGRDGHHDKRGGYGHDLRKMGRDLGAADAKRYLEHWLDHHGNERLKIGTVTEKDKDTITAEIVTKAEGALVERYEIDRHSGRMKRVN